MAKTIDRKLSEQMREESERTKDEPYPADARYTRLNRDRWLRDIREADSSIDDDPLNSRA